jgi:hypothetical protein
MSELSPLCDQERTYSQADRRDQIHREHTAVVSRAAAAGLVVRSSRSRSGEILGNRGAKRGPQDSFSLSFRSSRDAHALR